MKKASRAVAASPVRSSPPSLLRSDRAPSRGSALRSLWFVGCVALATAWSPTAAGQQPIDKDADAERLFREGQKLMEERRFGEACPKFEAAYRKDQQLGTLLNLAYCHKEQGAVWQSWLEFKEAEVKAIELKRNDRRDFARQRMAELERSLARVVVEPQQRVELTEVLVEDRRVPEAEKSHPFAAEPGQRKLTFRAKGKKQVVQLITITKGDRPQRISVPDMVDEQESPIVEPVEPTAEPTTPVAPASAAADRTDGSLQRTLGLVAVGAGVVGIGIGSVFGLRTLFNACTDGEPANKDDPNAPKTPSCTEEERNEASQSGAVSTVSFIAGGALVLGGILLYLTAPSAKPSATVGRVSAPAGRLRMVPEIGAGWAGVRGVF